MSESNKFTPGPWTNMPRMECVPICGQHEAGLSIGFISSSNLDRIAEGKANAYLIASAPDLLEALENLYRDSMASDFNEHWDSYKLAGLAISKARGQQ